jgi:hypothetical protein
MTEVTNAQIARTVAETARCTVRTAHKALEHGWMTIRVGAVRDRVAFALCKHRDLVARYSKEHYP